MVPRLQSRPPQALLHATPLDKEAILEKIKVAYLSLRVCPSFNQTHIENAYNSIPSEVDLLSYNGEFSTNFSEAIDRAKHQDEWNRKIEHRKRNHGEIAQSKVRSQMQKKKSSIPPASLIGIAILVIFFILSLLTK